MTFALLSGTMADAQSLLTAVAGNASAVGLRINMKRQSIRVGDFSSDDHPTLRVRNGQITEVNDCKYLGSWVKSPERTLQSDALTHIWQQTGCRGCGNQDVVERPNQGVQSNSGKCAALWSRDLDPNCTTNIQNLWDIHQHFTESSKRVMERLHHQRRVIRRPSPGRCYLSNSIRYHRNSTIIQQSALVAVVTSLHPVSNPSSGYYRQLFRPC